MSLDVYLTIEENVEKSGSGIFVREDGQVREVSLKEWNEKFPGREPVIAKSDNESNEVYSANITHNLGRMAEEAGIYYHLWRPDEIGISKAAELIEPLKEGLQKMKENPEHYKQFNASNGWGLYEHFIPWIKKYIKACQKYPHATVSVWR